MNVVIGNHAADRRDFAHTKRGRWRVEHRVVGVALEPFGRRLYQKVALRTKVKRKFGVEYIRVNALAVVDIRT